MPRDVARSSLYRGKINLWVEDEVTRSYLAALWSDPDILYLVGGGIDGVRAITHDAEQAGFRNVFAVVDRDLRPSNRVDWLNPQKTARVFVLDAHEIENHLLDPNALAASPYNNTHKSPSDLDALMTDRAEQLCWWAACREVVNELKNRFHHGFLRDPRYPSVNQQEAAVGHIIDAPWFQKLGQEVARSTEADVRQLLDNAHARARNSWSDGSWRREFAGKEILRHVGSLMADRTKNPQLSRVEFDADLAKEVADWQVEHQTIPPELVELRMALKARIRRADGTT